MPIILTSKSSSTRDTGVLNIKHNTYGYVKSRRTYETSTSSNEGKKELENTQIEAEVNGLVITFNGEMKAESTEFETPDLIPGLSDAQKSALESAITEAINKGIKKSQEIAAEKMQ